MSLRDPKLWLGALSVVLVTILVVVDLERTSPGPLSAAHAQLRDLDERDCAACHGDGSTEMAPACNACHTEVLDQLVRRSGFHGTLDDASHCGRCHTEHFGTEVPLVGERAFVLAGFAERAAYDHRGLAYRLTGKHDELACADCHANADVVEPVEGERRFLGASQDCASCHDDPHDGRMVKSCESCHGQSLPFTDLDGFRHTDDFPLVGAHANSTCLDCHAADGAYAVEELGGRGAPPARDCAACHESPHSNRFVASVADLLEITSGASCETCHPLEASRFTEADHASAERLHAASGFPLVEPHANLECASCHDPGDLAALPDPLRTADDCVACHESPHGEQFLDGAFAGADCLVCHAPVHFTPSIVDANLHARTGFALEDAHAESSCVLCHEPQVGAALATVDFGAAEATCAACHDDAHDGAFARSGDERRSTDDCAECHAATRFDDVAHDSFDHGSWTSFVLDGSHAEAACEACHERAHEPDRFGRRFGRVAELFGTPVDDCATCHANVHRGAMSARSSACADCHRTTEFAHVERDAFDHAGFTDFALRGAHREADCEQCHAPLESPGPDARTFGFVEATFGGPVSRCADCHEDPHGGRFDRDASPRVVDGRESCARCHDETDFAVGARERFDHARWTEYVLTGAHARAACEDCHDATDLATRYLDTPTACWSCHDDPHAGQFGPLAANDCERCHTAAESFDELVFDHDRDSRFALDANHAALDCGACHEPWPLAGGGEAVRYKPLGVECADCHLGEVPR